MGNELKQIDPLEIKENAIHLISKDWMLVTAGTIDAYNTMTASWGALGELWHKKVAICYIRPVRHTYEFVEKQDDFTLTFFDEKYRDVLKYCGHKSGRDADKMAIPELTAVKSDSGAVYFAEAKLVIECHKLYTHDLDPERFLDASIEEEYPNKDYHRMYIGEITRCLAR